MSRHIVATVDEIPPGGRKLVKLAGREIAVFRAGDRYHAMQDRCPHEGASLCRGRLVGLATSPAPGRYAVEREGEILRCPWHGWEFDITTGQSLCDPERVRVRSYPATLVAGQAVVPGPYAAETYEVKVENEYVVLNLDAPDTIGVTIARRWRVCEGVVALDLVPQEGAALPAVEPGAHINLHLAPGLVRSYSLCGDPGNRSIYRIAVLREEPSRGGSAAVHDALREGDSLRIGRPRNHFRMAAGQRRAVLVAGGIGITPLMTMAHGLLRAGTPFVLHYAARTVERAPFLERLRAGPIGAHLRTYIGGRAGGQAFDPRSALDGVGDAHIYVCGPGRLIDDVLETARTLGIPDDRLHTERFTADVDKTGTPFTVTAARSGLTAEVPADRSIAEVLTGLGIEVPLSCEQGVCGICLTGVVAGRPDHRDQCQSESEKAAGNRIAVCCSRSATPHLTLEL